MPDYFSPKRPIVRLALSLPELALSIGVSAASVEKMVAEGALPRPRRWHSRKLWLVAEVEAHLNDLPVDGEEPQRGASALDLWREQRALRDGQPGLPVPQPKTALAKYYRQVGFDPLTMKAEDLERLREVADKKWVESVPNTPMGKREKKILAHLAGHPLGTAVNSFDIRPVYFDAQQQLEIRGFIEVRPNPKGETYTPYYVLTEAGLKAWRVASGQ
ncbi:hypothetical protein GCM10007874_17610 [Labrys miyagiensis]|uniref:Helix-turn-helix domain-containing protein n=1 Tax=Labrys miyagiensis TaxID=346912 RepID=A0ABQ6CEU0_9HYPH|nr:hypothetical protein [Labrys miyagiensis]GLS18744.1 hypothetical protein GCM10007874_17610 [Labrys miyagiensis]